jgi:hypothetical protein
MEVPKVLVKVLNLILTAKAWETPTCLALTDTSLGCVVGPVPETANPSLPLPSNQTLYTSRAWVVLRRDPSEEMTVLPIAPSSVAATDRPMVLSPTL